MEELEIQQYSEELKLLVTSEAVKTELEQKVNHNHKLQFYVDEFGNWVIPYSIQFNTYYSIYQQHFMNMEVVNARIDYIETANRRN